MIGKAPRIKQIRARTRRSMGNEITIITFLNNRSLGQ
jgi:hypothetical protein